MKVIQLQKSDCLTNAEANALKGKTLGDDSYNLLLEEDCKVLRPNGKILLIFRRKVLSAGVCSLAYPALQKAAKISNNRGYAAGDVPEDVEKRVGERVKKAAILTQTRAKPLKKDGTVSNTSYAQEVFSGLMGYYDRHVRFPYCRTTAFNMHNPELFAKALPFIQEINKVFKQELPERYAAQLAYVKQTPKDFIIHKTAFSTVTVNKDWQTRVHKDEGDLKEGFGVMSALIAGKFKGCYLCFPKYKVAVNMRSQDVLLADVHQWHGNTPYTAIKGRDERISVVLYYRENMSQCGTAEEELERAKRRKRGDPING